MKCVLLRNVVAYKDSNDWLYEEVSGRLLITSIKFVTYGKDFIKVILFL